MAAPGADSGWRERVTLLHCMSQLLEAEQACAWVIGGADFELSSHSGDVYCIKKRHL